MNAGVDQAQAGEQAGSHVQVDIWSDVVCPWCYIGKRRFETALAEFTQANPQVQVDIIYHSFELSPDTPADFSGSAADYLVNAKGMSRDQVDQMLGQVTQLAAAEGLKYDYAAAQQTNTLRAHELLHFALAHGKQREVKERLLSGFFERGEHVGNIDTLVAVASEVGLPDAAARTALESGEYRAAVQQDIAQAREYGINGVPFFVFDGRFGVSGAQSPEVFVQALEKSLNEPRI